MEAVQIPDWRVTEDKIWATLGEVAQMHKEAVVELKEMRERQEEYARQMRESALRHDREMKESADRLDKQKKATDEQIKATGREMKESAEQLDRQIKATDKQLGKLGNRFGEMIEYLVMPNLVTKFRELGFTFTKAYPDTIIEDYEHNIFTEVDAFLENGDKVMIVEIKNKPLTEHIREHIRRMEKLRAYADMRNDHRQYLGAIAGVVVTKNVKDYAFKNGFFVIEPSGDTFNISEPTGEYKPKAW
ncbi:hypothetical protein FACS1894147_08820 [Spirochaetia bacterium]|nr:hypothetical protein FACS1894147_08820 [Spirochaetia bacterium]